MYRCYDPVAPTATQKMGPSDARPTSLAQQRSQNTPPLACHSPPYEIHVSSAKRIRLGSAKRITVRVPVDSISMAISPSPRGITRGEYGELRFLAAGVPLLEGVYLDDDEAEFVAAQWRQKARQTNVTEKFDAKRLVCS